MWLTLNLMGDRHGIQRHRIVGQKAPCKVKDVWALRAYLKVDGRIRELALFNLGIDSKLPGCDPVALKVRDVCHGEQVASRATIVQHKTQRPVQFEITPSTREAVQRWIKRAELRSEDFLFPSRVHSSPHLSTRQYARILEGWVEELGLDPADYGTQTSGSVGGRRSRRVSADRRQTLQIDDLDGAIAEAHGPAVLQFLQRLVDTGAAAAQHAGQHLLRQHQARRRTGIAPAPAHRQHAQTWASWAVQSGVPLFALQEMVGWETPGMARRYAHLAAGHLAAYADKMPSVHGTKARNDKGLAKANPLIFMVGPE